MEHHFFIDEPTPEERYAELTEDEKVVFHLAKGFYDKETGMGKRVFTVRAARKYELETLKIIFNYLYVSGKLDYWGTEKDTISFINIMRIMEEKTPPPTEEEAKRLEKIYNEWKIKCEERRALWEEEEE